MADIVISAVAKIAEYTVAPVLRQFGYLIYYKSNVKDLTEKVTTLTAKRDGVQRQVEGAKRNLEPILPDVQNWLERVNQTIEEKEICFKEERTEKEKICCSSNRWCPNLKVRYSLSRRAKKLGPRVDDLIAAANFTTVSGPAPPRKLDYLAMSYYENSTEAPAQPHEGASSSTGTSTLINPPAAPMILSERLEYRLPYTKDLLTALQDDKISTIGISGTFREIDTVTTKEFIKRMKYKNLFEEVVMTVVVSQDPDLKRIQDEVAEMLMLKLENGSLVERAERLRAASNSKRVLVILADVCGIPDLEAIGISHVDIRKSCKIMLISKQSNVFGEMETRSSFKLLIDSTSTARPVEFESRISVIRSVMDALRDDESNPIVVCGMGGIGKTTLVKEIGAKAGEVDLFDEIAFAEFTEHFDLSKVQGELANGLGLKFEENEDRAAKLRGRLSGDAKRKLVILDNVWKQEDLWNIGIPIVSHPKCCKLVVTSREQDIFNDMKTKRNFPINGLPQPDAWDLFKKMAGGHIESERKLRGIAEQVLKECGGLPVAISAVGKALIGKKIEAWKRALRQLQQPYPKDVPRVIKDAYGKIKFSYECLEDDSLKKFFLVWGILEDNGFMSELIKCGIGLGLFDGIETGWDDGQVFMDELRNRSLLLEGDGNEGFRMHDVVRHVALHIASIELKLKRNDPSENRVVFKQTQESKDYFNKFGYRPKVTEEFTNYTSLTTCIKSTEFLVLGSKSYDMKNELVATVFDGMESLKVLVIWNLILPSLPLLKDIRTLVLVDCRLEFDVDVIGELWKLMVLDLSGSDISQLPETFKNLSNLRLLNLSRCWNLQVISPGVMSSLSRLEEFISPDVFQVLVVEKLGSTATTNWISQMEVDADPEEVIKWKRLNRLAVEKLASTETTTTTTTAERIEPEEEEVNLLAECANNNQFTSWASSMDWSVGLLSELLDSSCLTALEVVLPPVDLLSSKLFHKLDRFDISIGWHARTSEREGKSLIVRDLAASSLVGTGISLLLKKTETLELMMKNLTDPLNVLDCCANLESLQLQDCDSLQYLIDMTLEEHTPRRSSIFPVLNYLEIKDTKNLKAIFHGDLPPGSLQKLNSLQLFRLPALTNVWSIERQSVSLGDLEQILIGGCDSLEAIFSFEGSGLHVKEINFHSLTHLNLEYLSSFTGMSKSTGEGQLEHSLFSDPKVVFPVLTDLLIGRLDNLNHIWTGQLSPTSFSELSRLDVYQCHKLLQLVPTQMQNRLQKLERILVRSCSSLHVMFEDRRFTANEGNASVSQTNKVLSNISQADQGMQINDIMDFKQSWHGFQNLTFIQVDTCGSLTNLFSPSIARGLINLEKLWIDNCQTMETIVAADETENESLLPHLNTVELGNLPKLRSFCEGKYNFDWPLVEWISIDRCDKLNKFCSGSLSISSYVRLRVQENLRQELNDSRKES